MSTGIKELVEVPVSGLHLHLKFPGPAPPNFVSLYSSKLQSSLSLNGLGKIANCGKVQGQQFTSKDQGRST